MHTKNIGNKIEQTENLPTPPTLPSKIKWSVPKHKHTFRGTLLRPLESYAYCDSLVRLSIQNAMHSVIFKLLSINCAILLPNLHFWYEFAIIRTGNTTKKTSKQCEVCVA